MHKNKLQQLCSKVASIVKEAGNLLELRRAAPFSFETKHDGSRVTEVDLAVEHFLIQQLSGLVPEASFYAEETGISAFTTEYVWVIDPLDGTTNYSLGIGYYCISVALVHNTVPILGVIYQPVTQELFTAIKGGGCFYNGTLITRYMHDLGHAVIACTGLVYDFDSQQLLYALANYFYTARIFGASALDMAYCALGKLEGIVGKGVQWWDVAAGVVLMQEAGCHVSTWQQQVVDATVSNIIGGSELIFCHLTDIVQKNI